MYSVFVNKIFRKKRIIGHQNIRISVIKGHKSVEIKLEKNSKKNTLIPLKSI